MAKKIMGFKTKGMNRDLSVSAFNPEFAFENKNLRLGTNEANTMMSWVNEKGTAPISIVTGNWVEGNDSSRTTVTEIKGTPIGTAVINHQLVVFTADATNKYDYIYVLKYANQTKTSMLCKMLFGNENLSLNFDIDHPIETLVSYESEKIQKVYWTDGINQPRVINIEGTIKSNNTTQFDFVPTLKLEEKITVKKILGASGVFAPGVIQYAFTYYTKYGQESNIFYTSPLLYISFRDRGASPEDKVENAFRITIENLDMNFDYLRIYSIQRTSINADPIVKRIQDIELQGLTGNNASFLDTGTVGENVDPMELLYKGGETISAATLEQKDNTLFFGNIHIKRPQIELDDASLIASRVTVSQDTRTLEATSVSTGSYNYASQLTSYKVEDDNKTDISVPCAGFKAGETYRLGVQFQYESGKWSDPIWVKDEPINNIPSSSDNRITLPIFRGSIASEDASNLISEGYKKVRGVVVFPGVQDRTILCQGVVNPTMYTEEHQRNNDLYAQSSWFFRASDGRKVNNNETGSPASMDTLPYTHRGIGTTDTDYSYLRESYNPQGATNNIRLVEIQGDYDDDDGNKFKIDRETLTFHSPDVEFDTQMALTDFSNTKYRQVGYTQFAKTMSDIDIQTETATISNSGGGFVHKSFSDDGAYGIIAGLFYDDYIVDEDTDKNIEKYSNEYSPCKWMVYPWHKSGSLNNDVNRPTDKGVASSILKKKIISNLRYADTTIFKSAINPYDETNRRDYKNRLHFPQIFSSDQPTILKLGEDIYMGNIDTLLISDNLDGEYFSFLHNNGIFGEKNVVTPFNCDIRYKMFSKNPEDQKDSGIYHYENSGKWKNCDSNIGDKYLDLVMKRSTVRMKYKSTSHLVFAQSNSINWYDSDSQKKNSLPVLEITQNPELRFGGTSNDAFRENVWLPCGEPVSLASGNPFYWEYGDTYYQRWDCLKTYAFTPEDINQIVEIGSFMLETHINIDGRYDRNRGQINNLNMSPINFNLLNPVYSQQDNFFQYKIQDEDFYKDTIYPNQIVWSMTKSSGAEVDAWTNMTMASNLELDGDKGEICSLQKFNNQLICFQNSGISRVAYNESYQVTTTQGVPIEIANSGKVQGKDYISNTVGCSNKWSIVKGVLGLYFMDSDGKDIYLFNGQLTNLSMQQGFNSWAKQNIPSNDLKWTPAFPANNKSAFVSYYDKLNQEIFFINRDTCLTFSEKFGVFPSFYDYSNTPFFNNLDDTGIWLRDNSLWKHQAGDYCRFFGTLKLYSMTLVGNPEPQMDKVFTNIEFRACVDNDGTTTDSKFVPYLPFDYLETWNEYQHGITQLKNRDGSSAFKHHTSDGISSLKRKFRIWRCDIPRDNAPLSADSGMNISRVNPRPIDRMRNPWLYLKLKKNEESSNRRAEIHDVIMTYFE